MESFRLAGKSWNVVVNSIEHRSIYELFLRIAHSILLTLSVSLIPVDSASEEPIAMKWRGCKSLNKSFIDFVSWRRCTLISYLPGPMRWKTSYFMKNNWKVWFVYFEAHQPLVFRFYLRLHSIHWFSYQADHFFQIRVATEQWLKKGNTRDDGNKRKREKGRKMRKERKRGRGAVRKRRERQRRNFSMQQRLRDCFWGWP